MQASTPLLQEDVQGHVIQRPFVRASEVDLRLLARLDGLGVPRAQRHHWSPA